MDNRDRVVLSRQLEDYTKLDDNEFWHAFLKYVEDEAQTTLRQLAKEEYEDRKFRYWQGAYKALMLVHEVYPDRLLDEIRREIDK